MASTRSSAGCTNKCRQGRPTGDEQIVRLESDADLVKVVTVHKSRGWNTPWSACRLPAAFGKSRASRQVLYLADTQGQRTRCLAAR